MVKEDQSQSALISLLNAYRAASHYGTESVGHSIDNSETFCTILSFTLSNANDVFRSILQISSSSTTKDALQKLQKPSNWKNMKPLIKSFVRSTLFLLNQITDSDILTFAMTRLGASILFFIAFPSLIQRLLKVTNLNFSLSSSVLDFFFFFISSYSLVLGESGILQFLNY